MLPNPPAGQGPIDPRGAFSPPGATPASAPVGAAPMSGSPTAPPIGSPIAPPVAPPNPPTYGRPGFPPGGFFPPPPPPWQPPPRGGFFRRFARMIFTTLAVVIFLGSLLLNLIFIVADTTGENESLKQTILEKGDSDKIVAVLPITGVITGTTADHFDKVLRQLTENSSIKALVLEIDTPGGELPASDEIFNEINHFKAAKKVPVVVTMGGMATSGGYYIACAGDYLVAEPTTLTANIGVVEERFNLSGLLNKYGVEDTSITPPGAPFKYIESPFRPEKPELHAYLEAQVDEAFARFKQVVDQGRHGKLVGTIDQIADGRALTATAAKQVGLIDEIDYPSAAYAKAASLASINNAQVVRFERSASFVEALGENGVASIGRDALLKKFRDGAANIDRSQFDQFITPRLMSIYRGN